MKVKSQILSLEDLAAIHNGCETEIIRPNSMGVLKGCMSIAHRTPEKAINFAIRDRLFVGTCKESFNQLFEYVAKNQLFE
jgi:hypothetical protein